MQGMQTLAWFYNINSLVAGFVLFCSNSYRETGLVVRFARFYVTKTG
jgi:hypothetical protein